MRRLRKPTKLSQEELADLCGYNRTYVGMIERSERDITVATLEALAGSLLTSACYKRSGYKCSR